MKRALKATVRKSLSGAKKAIIRVPILRKGAVRAKAALFPGLATAHRETYHYHNYYPSVTEHMAQIKAASSFKNKPLISLILPTYNTPEDYLRECLDSVLLQSYDNWELCIADDASPDSQVVKTLEEYAKKDARIKFVVREKNGHISQASNSAIELATGEYLGLLDHDDVLWPNALYEVVSVINQHPDADLIYSDEDKIDSSGQIHSYPFLKPDWSPEFLESCNYITHFTCVRTELIKEIGGFRKGCEGAQDWDLFIRVGEKTDRIHHIPKMLYSWRIHEASTAANTDAKPYVYAAQLMLLEGHLERTGRSGKVETGIITQHRTIKYDIPPKQQLAVVIFHQTMAGTKRLLQSMVSTQPGVKLSIYLISPAVMAPVELQTLKALTPSVSQENIVSDGIHDWEKIIATCNQEYLVLAKDTVELTTDEWAKLLIGDCQLEGVGMVGPVILDTSKHTVLSAGVGLGYGAGGYADMLNGIDFDDPHYARGLYAKSRRNVSALNDAFFAVKRSALEKVVTSQKSDAALDSIELAIELTRLGYRHIYSPYIKVIAHGQLSPPESSKEFVGEDPFLNPNFDHRNALMEVKA